MNAKRLVKMAVVAVALVGVVGVSACHRHHTPQERADWITGKIARHLDLDERQKASLAAVKTDVLAAQADAQTERRALTDALIAQVQSERLDQEQVTHLVDRHQALQRRTMLRVLPKAAEWHATLRPEQKAEAAEHLRKWMEWSDGHRREY